MFVNDRKLTMYSLLELWTDVNVKPGTRLVPDDAVAEYAGGERVSPIASPVGFCAFFTQATLDLRFSGQEARNLLCCKVDGGPDPCRMERGLAGWPPPDSISNQL